jgi:hypothetical protein
MPKRTNLFQEVVEILHRHSAGDATIEASAMLPSRSTDALREVDVVIRAKQAGHEVLVSVEAMARARKADRTWVDAMVGKHADLPTSKLVLVAEKGFTRDARAAAVAQNVVALAPEDLPRTGREAAITGAVPALWPKVVSFSIDKLAVTFTDEDVPTNGWGDIAPTVFVDGGVLGNLMELIQRLYKARLPELMVQIDLANKTENSLERWTLVIEPSQGDDIKLAIDDVPKLVFLLNENGIGYSVRRIVAEGRAEIQVSKIPLRHARLGDLSLNFGYGEGKIADRDALVVVSERDSGSGHLTIRIRPQDGDKSV